MKEQLPGFNVEMIKGYNYLSVFCVVISLLCFLSCENDIEKIKSFSSEEIFPTESGKDYTIFRSDSGIMKVQINAPKILHFGDIEEPYIEFPEGITVFFFDENQEIESKIKANYAIYYELEKLWHAKNDVIAHNLLKKEKLNTEEMFWDDENDRIYSNKFTKIVTLDGTYFGDKGFESNENFTKWKLKEISNSTVNISDE